MAKKKITPKKKTAGTKKLAPKKKPATAKKPASRKKAAGGKKSAVKKKAAGKKSAVRKKRVTRKVVALPSTRRRSSLETSLHTDLPGRRGLGAGSAGQSGDTQGLSNAAGADSESVEELIEEGQTFEASVVSGVENADSSEGEVRTTQVREDDVPQEYLDPD